MKKSQIAINPSVSLRISLDTPNNVEVVDNLFISPEVRETVLNPYVDSLYESLILRTVKPANGVPRYAMNEVSFFRITHSICQCLD